MASLLSWARVRDVFDANTADDRKRRQAAGRPTLYQQPRALTQLGNVARELPTILPRMNPVTAPQLLIPNQFKTDATKGVDEAFDALGRTGIGQNRAVEFTADNLVKPIIRSGARVSDVQTGQERYASGLKGVAELGTDAANIGSVIYAPAKAGVLAKGGMPALKVAPEAFVRGAGAGAGINLLYQASENGINNLDLKQAALAAGISGVANVALPAAIGKGGRVADNRVPLNEVGAVGKNVNQPDVPIKQPKQMSLESQVQAPKPVTGKARGFTKNMAKANFSEGNITAQKVIDSMPGYKPITNKNTLGRAAKAINENPTQVYAEIATKKQLTSADDVAKGNLLLRSAIESGDTEAAIQIGTKMGVDGTKLGQAVQAYSMFKRTTPEGIVQLASKKAASAGKELDPAITKELIEQAKAIQKMPESLEKAKATRALLDQADAIDRNWKSLGGEILSTPRAAMATADLSAPLRQGAVLGSRFPKQFSENAAESVKYFGSQKAYDKAMYEISQRPSYSLMKSHKLAVDGAEGITGTEEAFLKNILEGPNAKKLGVGHVVAASDRGYTGFLTKLRADVFDKVVADSQAAGVKMGKKELDSLAKFINSASGRGSGNITSQISRLQVLFSARLWKSRLDTFNPVYIAKLKGPARKLALQSAASFAGIATTVLGLAAAAGASVENDPRSADFGKVKVGNTRYDILGGHQQNLRLAAQFLSGEKINSETGELQTLGPDRGFGKPSRLDILYQFGENKLNPIIGFGVKAARQTDPAGNKLNLATEAAKLGIPLNFQSVYETAKDQGSLVKGAAMNIPGTFGIGVQTYGGDQKKKTGTASATTSDSAQSSGGIPGEKIAKADFEESGANGSVVQLDDGKYAVKQGDKVETADNLKDIYTKINKKELNESGMAYKVVGDTVYRQSADGKVTTTPKIKFDYDVGTATLTQQKRAGDLEGWMGTAEKQLASIDEQLKDPSIDPLEAIKLENQRDSLLEQAEKYAGYGGFKKGGGGGRAGGGGSKSTAALTGSFKTASKTNVGKPKGIAVKKLSAPKVQRTRKLSVRSMPKVRG